MKPRNSRLKLVVVLYFSLLLSACAPLSSSTFSEIEISSEKADTVMQNEEKYENSCQPIENELSTDEELACLKKIGKWDVNTHLLQDEKLPQQQFTSDFPLIINKQVEFYLNWFQTKKRGFFSRTLARSKRYLPMINQKLDEAGLPKDLAYLAFIESAYIPIACSHAGAVGLWQFIRTTGKRFGLKIDPWVDERRNPEKSTEAAVKYLANLHTRFDSWFLAVAGYNAGEGRIEKAVKRYNSKDFWELASHPYLKLETKRYVPKLIAAIIITKNPEQYGFTSIGSNQPLQYDVIKVPARISLSVIADITNTSVAKIKELNPELRRNYTPANQKQYLLKIPKDCGPHVAEKISSLKPVSETGYRVHITRKGESISKISHRYRISKSTVIKANNLKSSRIFPGQRLLIPFAQSHFILKSRLLKRKPPTTTVTSQKQKTIKFQKYIVADGDSLWIISRLFGHSIRNIKRWNKLSSNKLVPGEKLLIAERTVARNPS